MDHPAESIGALLPRWARWVGGVFIALALGAMAFAIFEPIQVLPRIRLAPGFSFVDQNGEGFTSEDARGQVTLYTFAYGDCGDDCDAIDATMREVAARVGEVDLGDTGLELVTVSFDPGSDTERLGALAAASGADGSRWRWMTSDPDLVDVVIRAGFGTWFEPQDAGGFAFDRRFVLVDGWGVVRGEYRYATLADDADTLIRHIGLLGDELRKATGIGAFAYEAAHVFLCYP